MENNKKIQTYVEFAYPRSPDEEYIIQEVSNRNINELVVPKDSRGFSAFGFHFFDLEDSEKGIHGKRINISGHYYIGGEKVNQTQIKNRESHYKGLLDLMTSENLEHMIRLPNGYYRPFYENTCIVDEKDLKEYEHSEQ